MKRVNIAETQSRKKSRNIFHSGIDSLSDDVLHKVLQFVGGDTYIITGSVCKRWKQIYDTHKVPKQTSIEKIYSDVCTTRNVSTLDFLKESGYDFVNVLCNAGYAGHLEVLKWARSNLQEINWNEFTFACTAMGGHLETLKWMHDQGCPWNSDTFTWAGQHGQIHVMEWLKSKGCPWDETTFEYTAGASQLEALQWLFDNRCPYSYSSLAHIDDPVVLQWGRDHGLPTTWNEIWDSGYDTDSFECYS